MKKRILISAASKQRLATEGISAAGQPSRLGDRIRCLMGNPKSQQIRLKHTWAIASLLILALALPIIIAMIGADAKADTVDTSHLKNVKFKIIDETTGEPLKNRELNICYFVYFKLKRGAPSPYLNKNEDFYITSKITDDKGMFILDLSSIRIADIVVEPGKPYNIVRFGRSSDLAHTKSADHIRVIRFKPGTTQVVSNMIYDLKNKKVALIYAPEGALVVPYEEILLVAKTLKESVPSNVARIEYVEMPVSYQLLLERNICTPGELIGCRIRIENTTDSLQFVFRPRTEDVSLEIKGLDQGQYPVRLEEIKFESLAKVGIPLRSKCAIEIKLGKFKILKAKEGQSSIPLGRYAVSVSWKAHGYPIVEPSEIQLVDEYHPDIPKVQSNDDEYPLGISLESSSKVYHLSEPIMLNIRIQNNGHLPVKLKNHFHPYKNHFGFNKKDAVTNKKIKESIYPRAKIELHAIEGWITLLPGESLLVAIDASEEFKTIGEYLAAVTYYSGPILLYPTSGKPYYTDQHSWTSKEIEFVLKKKEKQESTQVEGEEKESTKMLQWVDEETGQKLFDVDDIVRFDWDKQIFELTRPVILIND